MKHPFMLTLNVDALAHFQSLTNSLLYQREASSMTTALTPTEIKDDG